MEGQKPYLLDYLAGGGEQRRWDGEAESLRLLEINNEFGIRRLQDWQVSGLLAFENTSSVESAQPVHLGECAQDAQMLSKLQSGRELINSLPRTELRATDL